MALSDSARQRLVLGGIMIGLLTVLGLLNASSVIADRLTLGRGFTWAVPLVTEMSGAYSILVLTPAALWWIRRCPIGLRNWPLRVPMHVVASALFGVCATLIMWGSRSVLWHVLGWGTYDYGQFPFRFLMEYPKQLMAYIVIYGCVVGYAYAKGIREQEKRSEELERKLVEARLAALKMQLNPHFLFNTMNMISSFIHEDPDRADTMLAHLSDLLRLSLGDSDAQEVPLDKELRVLGAYLAIMSARFGDGLVVDLRPASGIGKALVPHLILQPLVENAIKHCTNEAGRPSHVEVNVAGHDGRLFLVIRDNGPGLADPPEVALSAGVGLSNTARRLKALYGDDHGLTLENVEGGGLCIRIDLPLRYEPARKEVAP